jgi:hypothetical protein
MVERVATAIETALDRQRISASWGADFSGVNPPLDVAALARAVIAAMREPTEAMCEAGRVVCYSNEPVDLIFQAMIDEELK